MYANLICLMSVPRSGSTLLASILSVHSMVDAIFEPINSKTVSHDDPDAFDRLLDSVQQNDIHDRTLLIKETSVLSEYISGMGVIADAAAGAGVRVRPVMLVREPLHAHVSEVQRRREWWGEDELRHTQKLFDNWCDKTALGTKRILELTEKYDGVAISYESVVANPADSIARLCDSLGLKMEESQLSYEKHVDRSSVRGDLNITNNPSPINDEGVTRREKQVRDIEELAKNTRKAAWYGAYDNFYREIDSAGLLDVRGLDPDMTSGLRVFN